MTPTNSACAALTATVDSLRAALALHGNSTGHLELARDAVQWQQGLAMYGLTVVVAVASILLVATWVYNLRASNRLIHDTVEKAKLALQDETASFIEARFTSLSSKLEGEVDVKLHELKGESSRLFAIDCANNSTWYLAAGWWARAIVSYDKAGVDDLLRVAVDEMQHCLAAAVFLPKDARGEVVKALEHIPGILSKELNAIKERIETLPENEPSAAPTTEPAR